MYDNNKYIAMPPGFPKFETEDGEKKIKFRLSKFDDNALVDPSITPGRVQNGASSAHACWLQIHVVFILLLQIVIMYAAHWERLVIVLVKMVFYYRRIAKGATDKYIG